jgi:hypothetical protein
MFNKGRRNHDLVTKRSLVPALWQFKMDSNTLYAIFVSHISILSTRSHF